MTDKDLLEFAAKAVGIAGKWDGEYNCFYEFTHAFQNPWNPLRDDGAALRLAVKLHMTVRCYMGNTCAQIGVPGQPSAYCDVADQADPYAATRRAIVLAAAQIGKAMP